MPSPTIGRRVRRESPQMRITGEQIRKEQEESRRRSQFDYEKQVRAPLPPPWDSFWREQERRERWSGSP